MIFHSCIEGKFISHKTCHFSYVKMWYLYTMKFYSATKKNEILSFANKWMELENNILSEVSQAQKAKNRMFSLMQIIDPKQMHQYYWTWVTH
jgi:hypothetical protein